MQVNKYIRNFLIILFPLYYIINLTEIGSFISLVCISLIIMISAFYMIKSFFISDNEDVFFKTWTALVILNIIGFFFGFDLSEGTTRNMFRGIMLSLLPFYPFYYFSKKGILETKLLIVFLLIILPVFIAQYYNLQRNILIARLSDNTDIVNNMAYPFVNLIPYGFLLGKKKILSGTVMLILVFFIIQSAKRGAIIIGAIGLLFFFYYSLITIEKRNRAIGIIVVLILIGGLSFFAYKTLLTNEYSIARMNTILEGNTSGRMTIYRTLFNTWYNSDNIINLIFGFGFASSVEIAGNFAHNDWLELLSNFGMVGIFIYVYFFYGFLKCCYNKKWEIDKHIIILVITAMWFATSMISMTFTVLYGFIPSILLGFIVGNKNNSLH